MNLGIIIVATLYIASIVFLIVKFIQNDMSIDKTLKDIKKIFSSCCIKNKKEVEKKLGDTKEVQKNLKEIDGDCKEPVGFPFDICLDGNMNEEDLILREKLIKILKNRKNTVYDGGKEKLVVPLEVTLFLTKSLNPLVNENGEIQIVAKHRKISDQIDELLFMLKNKDAVIYKDEEKLLNSLKDILSSQKIENKEKEPEETKEKKPETVTKKEFSSLEEIEELVPEQHIFPPEDLIEEEVSKKVEGKETDIVLDNDPFEETISLNEKDPFGNEEENPFDEEDSPELDLNDLLEDALSEIDIEEDKTEDIDSFYKSLTFKRVEIQPLDFENPEDSIKKIFSNEQAISGFFRNLAKTKPIILNENKEVAFADQQNVYFAISKLYGLDSKKYIDQFKKLKLNKIKELNKGIETALEIYLSDLRGVPYKKEFVEKEGQLLYSFGFDFQTRAFKTGLNQDEFDFFKSFPYNNDYILKGNLDIKEKVPRLISSIEDVEIK